METLLRLFVVASIAASPFF